MIKIYYLNNSLALGLDYEFTDTDKWERIKYSSQPTGSMPLERTNIVEFFAISKHIALIFDTFAQMEHYFESVISCFTVVQAGGGLVTTPTGDTLMIFRNGRWDLPKGKREPDESIELCALREVEEECGIKGLELDKFLHHTYHIYNLNGEAVLKQTSWFAMRHSGQGELQPQEIEGITKVKWIGRSELVCYIAETYPTIQDVFMAKIAAL